MPRERCERGRVAGVDEVVAVEVQLLERTGRVRHGEEGGRVQVTVEEAEAAEGKVRRGNERCEARNTQPAAIQAQVQLLEPPVGRGERALRRRREGRAPESERAQLGRGLGTIKQLLSRCVRQIHVPQIERARRGHPRQRLSEGAPRGRAQGPGQAGVTEAQPAQAAPGLKRERLDGRRVWPPDRQLL
jgi:hypothetical protein